MYFVCLEYFGCWIRSANNMPISVRFLSTMTICRSTFESSHVAFLRSYIWIFSDFDWWLKNCDSSRVSDISSLNHHGPDHHRSEFLSLYRVVLHDIIFAGFSIPFTWFQCLTDNNSMISVTRWATKGSCIASPRIQHNATWESDHTCMCTFKFRWTSVTKWANKTALHNSNRGMEVGLIGTTHDLDSSLDVSTPSSSLAWTYMHAICIPYAFSNASQNPCRYIFVVVWLEITHLGMITVSTIFRSF